MALYFERVSLLSLSQEYKYLEAGFNYSNIKTFTIEGNVTDLGNVAGVVGIVDKIIQTTDDFYNYQDIILNSVSFGYGRVQSLSFVPANDVQLDRYSATLTTFNNGDLANLAGANYPSVDTSNWSLLQNFTEDYNFTRKPNGGYSYTHSANIQFFQGPAGIDAIAQAKALAQSIFVGSALGFVFYAGYTSKVGKRYYTETYDVITNACSFQETFDFDSDQGDYSAVFTDSIQLQADGIVNVTENAIIRGITNPNFRTAADGFDAVIGGAYARCNGLIATYGNYGDGVFTSAQPIPVSKSVNYNLFIGEITYTITFTNDPSYNNTYYWEYTTEQTQQDGYFNASENGTVIGRATNRKEAYDNADAAVGLKISTVPSRISLLPNNPGGYYQISNSRTDSPFKGTVSYSAGYTNKPTVTTPVGYSMQYVTVKNDAPIYQWNKFAIFNFGNLFQDSLTSRPSNTEVELTIHGLSSQDIDAYLGQVNAINAYAPSDGILTSCNFSYNSSANTAVVSASWLTEGAGVKGIQI